MKKELIAKTDPKSPVTETFKTLRTNLQFMNLKKGELRSLLITSTVPGEGKTWVSSNLAIAFAQMGKKVILVDADMRKGRVAPLFQVDVKPGLSNYLYSKDKSSKNKKMALETYTRETEIANLYVMPTGDLPPNPSELLESPRTEELINELKEWFDIIIIDCTPSLFLTDALILSRLVDSTVIVSAHKITRKENLLKVKGLIENVGGNLSGIVLNKIPVKLNQYNYYSNNSMNVVSDKSLRRRRPKKNKI